MLIGKNGYNIIFNVKEDEWSPEHFEKIVNQRWLVDKMLERIQEEARKEGEAFRRGMTLEEYNEWLKRK